MSCWFTIPYTLVYSVRFRGRRGRKPFQIMQRGVGFTPRQRFPEAWWAQPPETLVEITGVPDVVFCHATGFYAVANTKEGAIALARKALGTKLDSK